MDYLASEMSKKQLFIKGLHEHCTVYNREYSERLNFKKNITAKDTSLFNPPSCFPCFNTLIPTLLPPSEAALEILSSGSLVALLGHTLDTLS